MRSAELFRTCANEHVAAAALACIGGPLKKRVAVAAQRAGLSSGAYVARLVVDYDRKASPVRRKYLEAGMFQDEMPLLAGLRHVVEVALDGDWDAPGQKSTSAGEGFDRRKVLGGRDVHWPAGGSDPRWQGAGHKILHS